MEDPPDVASDSLSVEELLLPPDDFLADEPEGAAFCKAFQASGIAEFDCRYLAIFRDNRRVAVVPYFLHEFCVNTMLPDGVLKKNLSWVKFRIACVGHPSADIGMIDGEISEDVLALVNAALQKKASLVAYKGFAANLPLPGFVRVRGLPVCRLNIQGDYYSGLDRRRRKDFRKKLQAASTLRAEEYSTLPEHLLAQVYQLYLNTLAQATMRFEILTPAYFEDERLIGFLQMLTLNSKANLKYMGMDYQRNRQYYLYFVMCLRALEACMRAGCKQLDLGVTSYQVKRLMGCEQIETSVYYRHNNLLINWLLGKFKFLLGPSAEELQ